MARATAPQPSNGLAEAIRQLTQAQAALVQSEAILQKSMAEMYARHLEFERETAAHMGRIDERFNRIEAILQALPDALGAKFGFHPPERG